MVKRKFLSEEEKAYLIDRYDPDTIIDALGLEIEELVDILEEVLVDNLHKFDIGSDYDDAEEEQDIEEGHVPGHIGKGFYTIEELFGEED
jgi:hypothetical protein